ncbi:hypothetical protein [Ethanoligenens sp.]
MAEPIKTVVVNLYGGPGAGKHGNVAGQGWVGTTNTHRKRDAQER